MRCLANWYVTGSLLLASLSTASATPPRRPVPLGEIHDYSSRSRPIRSAGGDLLAIQLNPGQGAHNSECLLIVDGLTGRVIEHVERGTLTPDGSGFVYLREHTVISRSDPAGDKDLAAAVAQRIGISTARDASSTFSRRSRFCGETRTRSDSRPMR
jgi:hypothetical protein